MSKHCNALGLREEQQHRAQGLGNSSARPPWKVPFWFALLAAVSPAAETVKTLSSSLLKECVWVMPACVNEWMMMNE